MNVNLGFLLEYMVWRAWRLRGMMLSYEALVMINQACMRMTVLFMVSDSPGQCMIVSSYVN